MRAEDVGIEWGAARSTVWFGARVRLLVSNEHDAAWYGRVQGGLAARRLRNVDCRLHLYEPAIEESDEARASSYVRAVDAFEDEDVDFALVDGVYRSACALAVIPKLRPGGLLIVDNVNWYLPGSSRAPNSRRAKDGPASKLWAAVAAQVATWRRYWTTNGVTDTAVFLKPPSHAEALARRWPTAARAAEASL